MRVRIEERRIDAGVEAHRAIAEWALPQTTEPLECSFTQLATPDTTKVCTYRLTIVPDDEQVRYLDLLRRYIEHIGDCEGIDYLSTEKRALNPHLFTDAEWTELRRISRVPFA